jgi:hypothetical protein
MSFFIMRMPSAGLRSRPPVSKHTPLPMTGYARRAGVAPFQREQARRARRGAADRVDRGEVALQQLRARPFAELGAVPLRELAHALGELRRAASPRSACSPGRARGCRRRPDRRNRNDPRRPGAPVARARAADGGSARTGTRRARSRVRRARDRAPPDRCRARSRPAAATAAVPPARTVRPPPRRRAPARARRRGRARDSARGARHGSRRPRPSAAPHRAGARASPAARPGRARRSESRGPAPSDGAALTRRNPRRRARTTRPEARPAG